MNKCFWRLVLVVGTAVILTGCGNKETKEALDKSANLEKLKQYYDANNVLVEALQAREAKIRAEAGTAADQTATDALNKKVQADLEILKMERAQIPLYLHLERADLASAVYADILVGNPGDSVVVDTLRDKDPLIRTGAARILGLMGKPEAIDALAAATKDPDQDVRRSAVAALGSIKDPRTVGPLIAALKDSYWFVRSEAANALGQEHDARAVKPLLDAVADPDSTVVSSAETALLFAEQGFGPDLRRGRFRQPVERLESEGGADLGGLPGDPEGFAMHSRFAKTDRLDRSHHAPAGGEGIGRNGRSLGHLHTAGDAEEYGY